MDCRIETRRAILSLDLAVRHAVGSRSRRATLPFTSRRTLFVITAIVVVFIHIHLPRSWFVHFLLFLLDSRLWTSTG